MSRKMMAILRWLCFAVLASLLSGTVTAQAPQATPTAKNKHKIGERIPVREDLSIMVVPAGSGSKEALSSKVASGKKAFVIEHRFDSTEVLDCDLEFGATARDKSSPILLTVGEEKIAPEDSVAAKQGVAVKDKKGKRHFFFYLGEGETPVALLFALSEEQLQQRKELILNFAIQKVARTAQGSREETYSFAVDLT